jgi:alkyl hydroperoxide reductase subunit AhpC
MRRIVVTILVALVLPLCSFEPDTLLNKPMPLMKTATVAGKVVDETYYRGHVTVVSFMYIGCLPCMNEIALLNKLKKEYAEMGVQVLCVAAQMKQQMIDMNADGTTMFSKLRMAMGAEAIRYDIQPACPDAVSKMQQSGDSENQNITLRSECDVITDVYGVHSFPTLFYVDKKGVIRKIKKGGPGEKNDMALYAELKADVDKLLAE